MRIVLPIMAAALLWVSTGCARGDEARGSSTADELARQAPECDHDFRTNAVAKNSWPYPASQRNLRWTGRYDRVKLKLKPNHASFVTATLTFREGDFIEVLDSEIHVTKPKRLVAKRDIFVTRKAVRQGIETEQKYLVAREGEPASFLFYNSEGFCMVQTDDGPAWTACTLNDTFEGLSAEAPYACSQSWWVRIQRSKVDRGWMLVNPTVVQRVGILPGEAK